MLSFIQFITEEKNAHMTHIEDSVIDGGVKGTRLAINHLRSLRDTLAGNTNKRMNISVKWDGAPAIFAGIDPSDGKFFVAKKGIFNKNPKVYKTPADIDEDTSGDLNVKLKLALEEFPKLGIKGVIQGDFLYAKSDLKKATIDDEPYITFHPNTIVYAIPEKSKLAQEILRSKIGVVWHTVYRGESFESMSASFGEEIASNLKKIASVWSVDAVFKDVSGTATMTKSETAAVTKSLSEAGKIFNKLPANVINGIGENETRRIRVNAFINSKIREGERIRNPKSFVEDLIKYLNSYFDSEIEKKKSEKGKESTRQKKQEVMAYFEKTSKSDLISLFTLYNLIVDTKMILIEKMNKADIMKTFLKTKDGYVVTGQEGFVAIDHLGKNALKLVDRLEFSKANFRPEFEKGWQR